MRNAFYSLACVLLFTACSTTETVPQIESTHVGEVDFSGSWELDYRLSEQADQKIRWKYLEAVEAERRRQASDQNAYRNRRGPSLGVDLGNSRRQADGVLAIGRLTEKIARSTVLTIEQTGQEIAIVRDEDFSLLCEFGDQAETPGVLGQERCYWFGDQLVFDTVLPEGLNVRHVFTISDNENQLNVATTLFHKQAGDPFTLNRVYIPFEPGPGLYNCEFKLSTLKTCRLGSSEP
jgi:hypothetical protein